MASVNEPFLLSSYSPPKTLARSTSTTANVYATHQQASTSTADGYVTVTAQGDGVNILDLSTLHPVVSHTLGPSTSYSCASVSRISKSRVCTTYSVVEGAQGIRPEDRGKTVRLWRDSVSGETDTTSPQVTAKSEVLPHRVTQIAAPEELPSSVLLLGPNCEITITDEDLVVQHSQTFEDGTEVLKIFVFDRSQTTFVPKRLALKEGAVIVALVKVTGVLQLRVAGADGNGIRVFADLPIQKKLTVLDASCSASGFCSILASSGDWYSLQIESPDYSTLVLTTPSTPVALRNLSFIATSAAESSAPFSHEVSLVSLGSSHVLLAGVSSPPSPELVLLLWDLQYSVLLASRTMALPTSIFRSKKQGIQLRLSGSITSQQAVFIISPAPASLAVNGDSGSHTSDDSAQRSYVYVVPLSVPSSSSVLNALGRALAGERWLASAATLPSQTNAADYGLSSTQTKLIRHMRTAMEQKRVEAADDAFFAWVAQEEGGRPGSNRRPNAKLPFGYQLVKQVLEIVFRTSKNAVDIPYSPKVVRYLMNQRCVSASMVDGGLFAALRLRNDWESMQLALKTVMDVPESDVVALLRTSVCATRQKQTDDNAMQVDAAGDSSIPPLHAVLPLCVTYTMSAPALRLAIRQTIPDAAELTTVLQVLNDWVKAWCAEDVHLLPERTKKDLHGAVVPIIEEKQKGALPPLDKILAFLQTLLDSSFLTFLTYPPSHDILREILSHLEPELTFTDDIEQLRGPLEPFVRAHGKAVHEAAYGAQKPDLKVDWRKRRKEAHEQAGIAVGVYQIDELLL